MVTYLTETQTAEILSISARTLQRYRVEGCGPQYRKAGRRVLYAAPDLDAWLAENSFSNTSEAKAKGGAS